MTKLTQSEIEGLLPHRGKALLIDSAEISASGKEAIGFLRVTKEHCEGHIPGYPLLRGVDMIEMAALTLGVLAAHKLGGGKIAFLGSIGGVKFRGRAIPDETVRAEVKIHHISSRGVKGEGRLFVEDRLIAEVRGIVGVIGNPP